MRVEKVRLVSIVISIMVLLFLIMLGPVQAFLLTITPTNPLAFIGDKIFFNVSASTGEEESLKINYFTLNITGPKNMSCSFFPNSTLVGSCPPLEIMLIENSSIDLGYGYGYAAPNSFLKYRIKLNSNIFLEGNYSVSLFANTLSGNFQSSRTSFRLLRRVGGPEIIKLDGCSLRAKEGSSIFNNTTFGSNNRLNVFVSSKNAKNGMGFFTSQLERKRISYSFNVLNATKIGSSLIILETSGTLISGQNIRTTENAIINYFPMKQSLEINGKSFSSKNMEVNFALC